VLYGPTRSGDLEVFREIDRPEVDANGRKFLRRELSKKVIFDGV